MESRETERGEPLCVVETQALSAAAPNGEQTPRRLKRKLLITFAFAFMARVAFGRAAAIFLSRCQRRVSEFIIIIILAVVIVARILSIGFA